MKGLLLLGAQLTIPINVAGGLSPTRKSLGPRPRNPQKSPSPFTVQHGAHPHPETTKIAESSLVLNPKDFAPVFTADYYPPKAHNQCMITLHPTPVANCSLSTVHSPLLSLTTNPCI